MRQVCFVFVLCLLLVNVVEPTNLRVSATHPEDSSAVVAGGDDERSLQYLRPPISKVISDAYVTVGMKLSTKQGSTWCTNRDADKIENLLKKGFDEAVGMTWLAGKLALTTSPTCGGNFRLLEALNDEEALHDEGGIQRKLVRLIVDIYRGPGRCRMCAPDDGDNGEDGTFQIALNKVAIDIGAHLTSKLQLEGGCLKRYDPKVTVSLVLASKTAVMNDCGF